MLSKLASPGFVAGPAVAWVALAGAALLMPLGPAGGALSFSGDVLLLIYLLALARFCTAWAAMETGSAFEGMGAAREVSYAVLAEAALIAAVLSLSVQTGSVTLDRCCRPRRARARRCWRRDCSPCCWRRTAACRSTIPTRTWN